MEIVIYKSKKTGKNYPLKVMNEGKEDERVEIDLENPISVNLNEYDKIGENNNFEIYNLKDKS